MLKYQLGTALSGNLQNCYFLYFDINVLLHHLGTKTQEDQSDVVNYHNKWETYKWYDFNWMTDFEDLPRGVILDAKDDICS